MMIVLSDAFNNRPISRHRSVKAAVKAQRKHSKDLARRSTGSYLWYGFKYSDGTPVATELLESVQFMVDSERY
jgi:hypothetical protein